MFVEINRRIQGIFFLAIQIRMRNLVINEANFGENFPSKI